MSTLIIRDATLAVNGAPENRGDVSAILPGRVEEVSRLDDATLAECADVLYAAFGENEDPDFEVVLGLTILSLARPEVVERVGGSGVALGRKVAASLEQRGEPEDALAVLEQLRGCYPGHAALERDYEAVLRRLGMVHDLADRYLRRANQFLKQGNKEEAIAWFKEVHQLDRSRKDVARVIRDLNLKEKRKRMPRKPIRPSFSFVLAILTPLAIVGLVQRERRLATEYSALPRAEAGDLDSKRDRLYALEEFLDTNPVWHGTLNALSERSDLRIEVSHLEDREALRTERKELDEKTRLEEAGLLYERARMSVVLGEYESALADITQALDRAPEDWEPRARAERDAAAIEQELEALAPDGGDEPAPEGTEEEPEASTPETEQ